MIFGMSRAPHTVELLQLLEVEGGRGKGGRGEGEEREREREIGGVGGGRERERGGRRKVSKGEKVSFQ